MKYRGLVGAVLLLPVLFLAFVAAIAAWDPIGVLWRSHPKVWAMGMRVMAACAIDSGKYDSYVLGTSMLENTSARELEKLFPGSSFANISISGSGFYERSFPLQHILSDNKAKRIIYSLDVYYIIGLKKNLRGGDIRFLYDNLRINNINIYFSWKILKDILQEYKRNKTDEFYVSHDDYNMPYTRNKNYWDDKRFGGIETWIEQAILLEKSRKYGLKRFIEHLISLKNKIIDEEFNEADLLEKYSTDIKRTIEYCERYLLKFVRQYPDVDFYMLFPPYSILQFATYYQTDRRSAVINRELVRYFTKMADSLSNLHVFGYAGEEFTKVISNYMDKVHYLPAINSMIANDIAQNRHMLALDNVEAYLEKEKKTALDFDLRGFAQKVEDYLESKRGK